MVERGSSLRLARIGGVDIWVHWSWLIVAGLIVLGFAGQLRIQHEDLSSGRTVGLALLGTTVFFGSVLLHELAHALVARRLGFEVKGITLYLFGGATEADVTTRTAGRELVVAIVGPLTSVAIAAALAVAALAGDGGAPLPSLLGYLAVINLALALFNMAPGLPLDGGRVLRAAVWAVTGDLARATRVAATGGIIVGYALIAAGLVAVWQGVVTGIWLAAIGWTITQGARQAALHEGLRATLRDLTAADVMSSPVLTVPAGTSIANAVRDQLSPSGRSAFPVTDGDEVVGLLIAAEVREVPAMEAWRTTVDQLARRNQPAIVARPDTPMTAVLDAMATRPEGVTRALVVDDGRLVGIISPTDVLRHHQPPVPGPGSGAGRDDGQHRGGAPSDTSHGGYQAV